MKFQVLLLFLIIVIFDSFGQDLTSKSPPNNSFVEIGNVVDNKPFSFKNKKDLAVIKYRIDYEKDTLFALIIHSLNHFSLFKNMRNGPTMEWPGDIVEFNSDTMSLGIFKNHLKEVYFKKLKAPISIKMDDSIFIVMRNKRKLILTIKRNNPLWEPRSIKLSSKQLNKLFAEKLFN